MTRAWQPGRTQLAVLLLLSASPRSLTALQDLLAGRQDLLLSQYHLTVALRALEQHGLAVEAPSGCWAVTPDGELEQEAGWQRLTGGGAGPRVRTTDTSPQPSPNTCVSDPLTALLASEHHNPSRGGTASGWPPV